ncbi:hypothetical protein MHSWG343_08970 [Candidatus Mycoplasma haematohominis]|uniref:Uncharacterized protein n=1 Tax=Candidatus Mycoplasma haematohominis TaxID=1494318 RepID=A0A478FV17_9MOLU|nr:hypothetical protein MHSWG343_08970 [Candidatus Mycoplasma haemohominis]
MKLLASSVIVTGSGGIGAKFYLKQGKPLAINTESIDQSKTLASEVTAEEVPKVTYGSSLTESKFTLVDDDTTKDVLLNILMERLDPSKDQELDFADDRLFKGSKPVKYPVQVFTKTDGKTLTTLKKPDEQYTESHKQACIEALKQPYDSTNNDSKAQLARLREWCTIPTIKDVLSRHKFTLLRTDNNTNDADWKEIIKGGWFSESGGVKYWEKQTFIEGDGLEKIIGADKKGYLSSNEITDEQIKVLKDRCEVVLKQPFKRDNFYLTKDFIDGLSDSNKPKVDEFQEAALFCSKSVDVEHYVTNALGGSVINPTKENDYCSLTVGDVKAWKTNTPMEGKSFWCGVRISYGPKKTK